MKRVLSILLMICLIVGCFALSFAEEADETTTSVDTTFDFSEQEAKIKELGIPTVASVAEQKKAADDLWKAQDYVGAADAYATYAKQANWLANLITAGLEPYYGASYDNRKNFSFSGFKKGANYKYDLADAETKANSYKSERNRAMLREGLCYYNLKQYEVALPLIIKALDLIDIKDTTNWQIGMNALYDIIGY